jgi:electron transfer flavoprotein beta subunit
VKIFVTAKRVTDFNAQIRLRSDGTGIDLQGVEYTVNPFDENAIEEAIRLRDEHGGEVVVISVGPDSVESYIRMGMAMGGDRGIRVNATDEELDSDAVARVLVALVEKEAPDLVLLGKQAIDGDNNQVGQLLAGYLGWPQACYASELTLSSDLQTATVVREIDGGLEQLEVGMPAVITSDLRLNEPRYASLPGIMKAKRKPIDIYEPSDLSVDITPKVRTIRLETPAQKEAGVRVESTQELVEKLRHDAKAL